MKIGIRTPSFKKSFKARTTGRVKRSIKRSINPVYGKKGMGWINNPKKAMYNKVYNKTTIGASFGDMQKNRGIYNTNFLKNAIMLIMAPVWGPFCLVYLLFKFLFKTLKKVSYNECK